MKGKVDLNALNIGLSITSLGLGIFPPLPCIGMIGISSYEILKDMYSPDKKLQTVFKEILKEEKQPSLVKIDKLDKRFIAKYRLKPGTSTKDFEKHSLEIAQYLNGEIQITYDDGLMEIDANMRKLNTKYPFKVVNVPNEYSLFIGHNREGEYYLDLREYCHTICAGTTGSGKSTFIKQLICNLLLNNQSKNWRLVCVDMKGTELGVFRKCKRVVNYCDSLSEVPETFKLLTKEMNSRNKLFKEVDVNDITEYNQKFEKKLKRWLVVIDEFPDIIKDEYSMEQLHELLRKARSAGIHFMLSILRPDAKIINGTMKSLVLGRISFRVPTDTDSQVILDENGAEKISIKGRGLVKTDRLFELQPMFINDKEKSTNDVIRELIGHTFVEKNEPQKDDGEWF